MILRIGMAALLALAAPLCAQPAVTEAEGAQLRAVDRLNGEVYEVLVPAGGDVDIDRIKITLNSCRYPVGNPAGEAYASLEVTDIQQGRILFSGWMIASSPALSAMDHPRYDIWVMRCTTS